MNTRFSEHIRKIKSGKRFAALLLTVAVLAASLAVYTAGNAAADDIEYIKVSPAVDLNSYNLGEKPDFVSLWDLGWRNGSTVATSTVERKSYAPGFERALVTDSEVEEGQGPYNGTPNLSMNVYMPVSAKTDAVMLYIKIPTYGTESLDPWPPYDWSLRCHSISVSQESTGKSGLYSIAGEADLYYLDIKTDEWQKGTLDGNGTFFLPSGFEGYVKFNISEFDGWSNWVSSGFDPNQDYKLDNMQFVFGWLGGQYGSFEIGGIYSVLEDSMAVNMLLDGETVPVPMVKSASAMIANTALGDIGGNVGDEISSDIVAIKDLGYRQGTTAAKAYVAEHTGIIGTNNAIKISSDVAEGEGPDNATPNVSLKTKMNINALYNSAMFYIEIPEYGSSRNWAVRIRAMSALQEGANSGNYLFSDATGMKVEYLEADGEAWKTMTVGDYGTLSLPTGFKGYIKLDLSTATHYNDWVNEYGFDPNKSYTLYDIDFIFAWLGGEYGDFVIGGVYEVVRDTNGIEIELDGNEKVAMTKIVDRHDANVKYTFDWINSGDNAVQSGFFTISDRGYYPGTTAATAIYDDSVNVMTNNRVIRLSAPTAEGQGLMNTTPSVSYFIWSKVAPDCNTIVLYVETPKFDENNSVNWSVKLPAASFQQTGANNGQWLYSDFGGVSFDYLERDGKEWVASNATSEGALLLPNGFKGYIKLHLDTLPNFNSWINNNNFDPEKEYSVNSIDFQLGYLGGNYGDFVIGDIYQITRESNSTKMKLNGTIYDMTTYDADNKKRVEEFTELVNSINGADLSAAVTADAANALYTALADEYKALIDKESLAKLNAVLEAVEIYRPQYLGVKIKAPDSGSAQAMKFGAVIDTAAAAESGYEFVSAGTVIIYELDYGGEAVITTDYAGVTELDTAVSAQDNIVTVTAVLPIENTADYSKNIIARFYAVYKNTATGEEITVYSGDYTFQNGATEANFKSNLIDAAGYFGVSLFGSGT